MSNFFIALTAIPGALSYEGDGYVIQAYPSAETRGMWRWRIISLDTIIQDPKQQEYETKRAAHDGAQDWIADRMARIAEVLEL